MAGNGIPPIETISLPTTVEQTQFSHPNIQIKSILLRPDGGDGLVGQTLKVGGWVKKGREQDNGSIAVLELNDRSCSFNLQLIIYSDVAAPLGQFTTIDTHLDAEGVLQRIPADKHGKQLIQLKVSKVTKPAYPNASALVRISNALACATYTFFQKHSINFSPMSFTTPSIGEPPKAKGSLSKAEEKDGKVDYGQDFFARSAFLNLSQQDFFTFGPTFHAEHSHTSRHLAEFWMVEPEILYADIKEDMNCAEAYISYLCQWLLDKCLEDIEFMNDACDNNVITRLKMVAETKFKRISYTNAVAILEKAVSNGHTFENKVEWGIDFASEHKKYLTETKFESPVIVYNYPKGIKAFYMKLNPDKKTVAAMDVLVPKVGELIVGSQREENYEVIKERIVEMGLPLEHYECNLDKCHFGTMKHSGFGLCFERLILFATGIDNIRDVIPPIETFSLPTTVEHYVFLQNVLLKSILLRADDNSGLDERISKASALARICNELAFATFTFFQDRGSLFAPMPFTTTSFSEGAGEMFHVMKDPTLSQEDVDAAMTTSVGEFTKAKESLSNFEEEFYQKPDVAKKDGNFDYGQDFLARGAFLSPCVRDFFTFGPTFRAENSHTSRHLAEFWMVEPEMVFVDIENNMNCAEAYIKFLCQWLLDKCLEDLKFMRDNFDKNAITQLQMVAKTKFKRLSYTDAVKFLEEAVSKGHKFENKVEWGTDLASEHEKYLTETKFKSPVIVYNYPKGIKAFYMKLNPDKKTVAAMDVLVPKVGELIGGSQREENYEVIEERILERGLPLEHYECYLYKCRFGQRYSGFGLCFERLILFATGIDNIRNVIPPIETVSLPLQNRHMMKLRQQLPIELIVEILLCLPVKPLLRFKSVSRLWCSLISNPEFVDMHLAKANRAKANQRLMLLTTLPNFNVISCSPLEVLSGKKTCTYSTFEAVNFPIKESDGLPNFVIEGSCNGLFCISSGRTLCIWNPCTREYKFLPRCNFETFCVYGFGYDEMSKDYKVVAVNDGRAHGERRVSIYSFNTGVWKIICDFPCCFAVRNCTFFNGSLYWIVLGYRESINTSPNVIASLDLSNETFGIISQPVTGFFLFDLDMSVVSERLCVSSSSYIDQRREVFVMDGESSWTKVLTIPRCAYRWDRKVCRPLCLSEDAKLLMIEDGRLVLYDPSNSSFSEFMNLGENLSAITFVESLVSISGVADNED